MDVVSVSMKKQANTYNTSAETIHRVFLAYVDKWAVDHDICSCLDSNQFMDIRIFSIDYSADKNPEKLDLS